MKPYDLPDWVDYVRGLGDEQSRAAMAEHLSSSDDGSAEDVRLLEEVGSLFEDDRFGPSEAALWSVKALPGVGTPRPPVAEIMSLPALPVTLVSMTRASVGLERQDPYPGACKLQYQSDRFELDIWLEDPQGSIESVVLGQVAIGRNHPHAGPVAGASVFLVVDGVAARSTVTNEFGEFHIEASPEGDVVLKIVIRDHGQIEFPLPHEGR